MTKIRITKLEGKPTSHIKAGYWIEGVIENLPVVGKKLEIIAPIKTSLGEPFVWFDTTRIEAMRESVITTTNSKWKIEALG